MILTSRSNFYLKHFFQIIEFNERFYEFLFKLLSVNPKKINKWLRTILVIGRNSVCFNFNQSLVVFGVCLTNSFPQQFFSFQYNCGVSAVWWTFAYNNTNKSFWHFMTFWSILTYDSFGLDFWPFIFWPPNDLTMTA